MAVLRILVWLKKYQTPMNKGFLKAVEELTQLSKNNSFSVGIFFRLWKIE
jgi:hypothetical protein